MDFLTKVIKAVHITDEEKANLQSSLFGLTIGESNLRIIQFLQGRIYEHYDELKFDINVTHFVVVTNMELKSEMVKYITMYQVISSYEYNKITPFDVICNIEEMCKDHQEHREYCYTILSQMNISIGFKRVACVALLKYSNRHESCIEILNDCIEMVGTILDKYYCLALLKFIQTHDITNVVFSPQNYCSNDIKLFDKYTEQGFQIMATKNENVENIKELGMQILSSNHVPFQVLKEYEKTESLSEAIGGKTRYVQGFSSYSISDGSSGDVDLRFRSYYVTLNGNKIKMFEFIDNRPIVSCQKFSHEDYCCMVAFISQNYDECLKYYSKDTNSLLMTMVANQLLKNQNEDIGGIIISFIADTRKFKIDTRIRLAYCFKETQNVDYLQQSYDILSPHFYKMTNTQKAQVRNLISPS